jgi:cysteine-rich repeat protein
MGELRFAHLLSFAAAAALVGSCAPAVETSVAPPTMRLLGGALLSELGPFHVRIFAKTGATRCDAAMGQVLVNGRRDLAMLPGRNVQPADRCGAQWTTMQSMYGTASPVDECMRGQQLSSSFAAGTYIVLVHGQGDFRTATGETRSGIRGSGCAEVTLAAGASSSITLAMVEQVDDRAVCGDGRLDSNESCDLAAMNGAAGSGCSAQCQTVAQLASNNVTAAALGERRHAAVSWGAGAPLVVGFDVVATGARAFNDVRARYFTVDGAPGAGALLSDVALDDGSGVQQNPSLTPATTVSGFVAAWESGTVRNVLSEAFGGDRAPPTTADPRYVSVPVAAAGTQRTLPSVAVAGGRAMVVWREGTDASATLFAATYPVALPLGAPSAPAQVATATVGAPRAVALRDGTFAVVYASAGDIFARRVTAMGAPAGDPSLVSPVSAQIQDQPAAAALDDGLVVAWRDDVNDASNSPTIRWARVGANLQRVGDAREAPTTTAGNQLHPTVAVGTSAAPSILIAWEDESTRQIRGRLVRADGSAVFSRVGASTNDFQISDGDGAVLRNDPAAGAGGATLAQFAVAWEDTDASSMPARRAIMTRLFPQ